MEPVKPTAKPKPVDTRSEARKALDARNAELAALAQPKVLVRQRVKVSDDAVKLGDGRGRYRNTTVTSRTRKAKKADAAARKVTRKQRILAHVAGQ